MSEVNPYWEAVLALPRDAGLFMEWPPHFSFGGEHRTPLVREYAWAITSPDALDFVVAHSGGRVVEMGAGTGYWAWQLAQRGVAVDAYDISPPPDGWFHHSQKTFHLVTKGGPRVLASERFTEHTLLLSWPPYKNLMALTSLRRFRGRRLIYIGEGRDGCTASDGFFDELDRGWREVASTSIVQWGGIHDGIAVYERKQEEK